MPSLPASFRIERPLAFTILALSTLACGGARTEPRRPAPTANVDAVPLQPVEEQSELETIEARSSALPDWHPPPPMPTQAERAEQARLAEEKARRAAMLPARTPAGIDRVKSELGSKMHACYTEARLFRPALGNVHLHLVIVLKKDGTVKSITDDGKSDQEVSTCVQKVMRTAVFEKDALETTLHVPVSFQRPYDLY